MKTGYEMSYADFVDLLSEPSCQKQVAPLLHRWFGYNAQLTADGFTLDDGCGHEISPQAVHEAIQGNPLHQYEIYQAAMSLWR